jgi:lipoate-protein ligase A
MQKTMNAGAGTIFGRRRISLFGYDKLSAGRNMAVDEGLMRLAGKENRFFVRFYDFERPAVILAAYDHPDLVKNGGGNGFDVCRRMTGGRPICMNGNTLGYSITGPAREADVAPQFIHKNLGGLLADTIESMIEPGHEVNLGKTSSVRIDGKPIAGHGQFIDAGRSFLYHGLVVAAPWDAELIGDLIEITPEDRESIGLLPNISDLSAKRMDVEACKRGIIEGLSARLPKANLDEISAAEKSEAFENAERLCAEKYANSEWTYRRDVLLRRDVRFCILYEDGQPG